MNSRWEIPRRRLDIWSILPHFDAAGGLSCWLFVSLLGLGAVALQCRRFTHLDTKKASALRLNEEIGFQIRSVSP